MCCTIKESRLAVAAIKSKEQRRSKCSGRRQLTHRDWKTKVLREACWDAVICKLRTVRRGLPLKRGTVSGVESVQVSELSVVKTCRAAGKRHNSSLTWLNVER